MSKYSSPIGALLSLVLCSCLPSHLKKYQDPVQESAVPVSNTQALDVPLADKPGAPATPAMGTEEDSAQASSQNQTTATPASIVALDEKTFRFALADDVVWDAMLSALLKNYNLNLVSREQGLLTTEWDTYHLNDVTYRNKISARLTRSNRRGCELVIHNKVEQLSDSYGAQPVWLPGQDGFDEPMRLVKNIAIILRQPPPQAPPRNLAKDMPELDAEPK